MKVQFSFMHIKKGPGQNRRGPGGAAQENGISLSNETHFFLMFFNLRNSLKSELSNPMVRKLLLIMNGGIGSI